MCIIYIALILGTTLISVYLGLTLPVFIVSIVVVVFCYRYILKKNQTATLNYIRTITNIPEANVRVSGFIRPTIELWGLQYLSWSNMKDDLYGVKFERNTLIGYRKDVSSGPDDPAGSKEFYVYNATDGEWKSIGRGGCFFPARPEYSADSPEDLKKKSDATLDYIRTMTNIPEADVQVSGIVITLLNQTALEYRGEGSKRHLVSFETRIYGVKFEENTLIGYCQDTTKVDYVYNATEQEWLLPEIIRDLEGETH